MLGRDRDAITFLERSMALHPDMSDSYRQNTSRQMAAAYARLGELDRSRRALAEAERIWPFDTIRGHWPEDPTTGDRKSLNLCSFKNFEGLSPEPHVRQPGGQCAAVHDVRNGYRPPQAPADERRPPRA